MPKITEYTQIAMLNDESVFLVDGSTGTKKILTKDAIIRMLEQITPNVHMIIPRCQSLGSTVTSAQKAAIQNRTYTDLWLGDYWTINGVNYRIVDFEYFTRCGDTDFDRGNIQIVPDNRLYNYVMNNTNTTDGGYVGSKMYTEGLDSAKSTIASAFGDMVLSHREFLVNAVSNGKPSGGAWYNSTVELMNEHMVYGAKFFGAFADYPTVPANSDVTRSQLALFRIMPKFINNDRQWSWLRDVATASRFAAIASVGGPGIHGASNNCGVRPIFSIG